MDIACPTCTATYEIDDATVAETGRKVRCVACGTIWRAFRDRPGEVISAPAPVRSADLPEIEAAPPLAPSEQDLAQEIIPQEVMPRNIIPQESAPAATESLTSAAAAEPLAPRGAKLVREAKPRKVRAGGVLKRMFAWPLLVMAGTAALAGGAYSQRERIVRVLPQSAAVFVLAGAPVNLRGIDIRDVKSRMAEDNGVNVLVVDGNLVSLAKDKVNVPRLRLAVLSETGQEIYVWSAQADRATLQPGETLNFRRRLAAPPVDGRSVSVRFLSASDITAGLK
jgi:predicted Zn finger-like uncharacterized protein